MQYIIGGAFITIVGTAAALLCLRELRKNK